MTGFVPATPEHKSHRHTLSFFGNRTPPSRTPRPTVLVGGPALLWLLLLLQEKVHRRMSMLGWQTTELTVRQRNKCRMCHPVLRRISRATHPTFHKRRSQQNAHSSLAVGC